jgi:hypothetical protein
LDSLEGILQFTLKHRLPSSLDEAQDFACQIEENLKFEDSIHQINLLYNNDPWGSNNEGIAETEPNLPEILEVEPSALPRKWSTRSTNIQDVSLFSQEKEPPEKVEPIQNIFVHTRMKRLKFPYHKFTKMTFLKKFLLLSTR